MNGPLISVIIPVYNVEKYLSQCINSVLVQTYSNFEMILVDDGSIDSSGMICDEYKKKDKRVDVIHKKNGGSSSARNMGLKVSKGEYIIFLDSDDFLSDIDAFKILIDILVNKKYDFILFKSQKYYYEDKIIDYYGDYNLDYFDISDTAKTLRYMIKENKQLACAWNKIVKKSILVDNNIMFVENIIGEDIDWIIRLFEASDSIYAINKFFHMYRQERGTSITASPVTAKKVNDVFYTIKILSDKYKNTNSEFADSVLSFMAFEYAILLCMLSKCNGEIDTKDIKNYAWLFKYAIDKKTIFVKLLYIIFGFKGTVKCLNIIRR